MAPAAHHRIECLGSRSDDERTTAGILLRDEVRAADAAAVLLGRGHTLEGNRDLRHPSTLLQEFAHGTEIEIELLGTDVELRRKLAHDVAFERHIVRNPVALEDGEQ